MAFARSRGKFMTGMLGGMNGITDIGIMNYNRVLMVMACQPDILLVERAVVITISFVDQACRRKLQE